MEFFIKCLLKFSQFLLTERIDKTIISLKLYQMRQSRGAARLKQMQEEELKELLYRTQLFEGMKAETARFMIQSGGCCEKVFQANQVIDCNAVYHPGMGIIWDGKARIIKQSTDAHPVFMKFLQPGQPFGIAALYFETGKSLSEIRAEGRCRVLMIGRELMTALMTEQPIIGINYIRYLSGRIHFLNRKIEGFTGFSTRSRLEMYLIDHAEVQGTSGVVTLSHSLTALANALSVGRASLYRALDALEEEGIIRRENRTIWIDDIRRLDTASYNE